MVGVVLAVVVSILYIGSYLPKKQSVEFSPPSISSEELHAQWVSDVHRILNDIGQKPTTSHVEKAKNELLQLRVASQDKATHLSLVLALVAWQQGKSDAVQRVTDVLLTI